MGEQGPLFCLLKQLGCPSWLRCENNFCPEQNWKRFHSLSTQGDSSNHSLKRIFPMPNDMIEEEGKQKPDCDGFCEGDCEMPIQSWDFWEWANGQKMLAKRNAVDVSRIFKEWKAILKFTALLNPKSMCSAWQERWSLSSPIVAFPIVFIMLNCKICLCKFAYPVALAQLLQQVTNDHQNAFGTVHIYGNLPAARSQQGCPTAPVSWASNLLVSSSACNQHSSPSCGPLEPFTLDPLAVTIYFCHQHEFAHSWHHKFFDFWAY